MALTAIVKFSSDQFPVPCRIDDQQIELDEHDFCLVLEPQGIQRVGYVMSFERRCAAQVAHLGKVLRIANDAEIVHWHEDQERRQEALVVARARVAERNLPMKIISVTFDDAQNVVLFNFTSDRRVDFRELVRDLASHFRARIELWQIGSRQGAADKDGFGVCGNRICCASWIHSQYPPVSMRHVRDQDLANQTPQKLAGLCGRLRCCLRYEHDNYCNKLQGAPAVGVHVRHAGDGREGVVIDRNLLLSRALIKFNTSRGEWVTFDRLCGVGQSQSAPPPPQPDENEEIDEVLPE
ncbi:MAG: regulatory iron-sulfur-containing complex subunit RicT [Candidatus Sumerlaeia bacterium]